MRIAGAMLLAAGLLLSACGKEEPQANFSQAPAATETQKERTENVRDAFKEAPTDSPADEATTRDIQSSFDRLAKAGRAYDKNGVLGFIDFDSLCSVIVNGIPKSRTRNFPRAKFISEMKKGAKAGWFKRPIGLFDWVDVKVMRVDTSADGKMALAYVRHSIDEYGGVAKARWWLTSAGGGWRIYDWEFLNTSIRTSRLMQIISSGSSFNARQYQVSVNRMQEARVLLTNEDVKGALDLLTSGNDSQIPDDLLAVRHELIAECQLLLEQPAKALQAVQSALALRPGMPDAIYARARANLMLKNYEKARTDFVWYIETLGSDATAMLLLADCLTWLDKNDEAKEMYRDSLKDYPSYEALLGLAYVTDPEKSPEEAKELGDWFLKLNEPETFYLVLLSELYDNNYWPAQARAINVAFRTIKPEDTDLAWYTAKLALDDDKPELAADTLKPAIARAPEDETQAFNELYWTAMATAGKSVDALREVTNKGQAFRYLASNRRAYNDLETLNALCELYKEGNEKSVLFQYYSAEFDYLSEDYAAAEAHYREGLKHADANNDFREAMQTRVLECMQFQGRTLEAYAEGGKTTDTFVLLADMSFDAEKPDALEKLIAEHAESTPKDGELVRARGNLSWLKKEWEQSLASYKLYLKKENRENLGYWDSAERAVRAALRTSKPDEALKIARTAYEEPDEWLLILTHAGANQPQKAIEAINTYIGESEGDWVGELIGRFYKDEDIGEKLKGEAYAELHKRFPIPAPELEAPEGESD